MAVESYEKLMGDLKKLRLPAMIEMLDSYVKQAASNSMSVKRRTTEDVYVVALQRLSDKAKAILPES